MTNLENECVHLFSDVFIPQYSVILGSFYQKIRERKEFLVT
jgi:hypothetical protein